MRFHLSILFLFYFYWNGLAQISEPLIPIEEEDKSPVGTADFVWGCVANFNLSDERNWGRIKFVSTAKDGAVYVVDNNGYVYGLDGNTFEEKWKVFLRSEFVQNMEVSPDGSIIVLSYIYSKSFTKTLDIYDAHTGKLLRQIKRITDCYDAVYLGDVLENTTLYPQNIAFSPDGSMLAVWFNNHGFTTLDCRADELHQFAIFNPQTGDLLAASSQVNNDFGNQLCSAHYPFVFSKDNQHIFIANCQSKIIKYKTADLSIVQINNFSDDIENILANLGTSPSRNSFLSELVVQENGEIITSIDSKNKGFIFKINENLTAIDYITTNQDSEQGHFSFSPNGKMAMCNSDQINLWEIDNKRPILYDAAPKAFDANTVRFHPTKKAIIVGTNRTLKLLAPCPSSIVSVGTDYTPTGHFLNAGTTFCVRGRGKIYWAYGNLKIYKKFAQDDEITTENLGFSNLFNKENNISKSIELKLKADKAGSFVVFGGTKRAMTNVQALQNLSTWD